jgi:hypothetical protein
VEKAILGVGHALWKNGYFGELVWKNGYLSWRHYLELKAIAQVQKCSNSWPTLLYYAFRRLTANTW